MCVTIDNQRLKMADMQIVPARKNVEPQYVEMMVPLYSHGCEMKVKKALAHFKGIYSINVDYIQQKVTVWGICNKYDVLATIKRKRKGTRFWNSENNTQVEFSQSTRSSPSSASPKRSTVDPLSIIKGRRLRSMSWKSWKKVFGRSYSF